MGKIIELPQVKQLKGEIQNLQKKLADYVCERDELRFTICKNIETQYMLEIGALEYKVYNTYCYYLRLRRKKELIQARKNRREHFIPQEIDRQLDEEFQEYREKLAEKLSQMNKALERSQMDILSEDETQELKSLYRSLVKRLHPDLNPSLTPAERELFYHVTQSYENGDLVSLQIISEMTDNYEDHSSSTSSIVSLQNEIKRLKKLVDQVKADIEKIKKTPPYSWRIYLEDEAAKREKIFKLNSLLKNYQEAIRTQEELINKLTEA